jgi:hypothetical protein
MRLASALLVSATLSLPSALPVDTLQSIGALPAHIAGRFTDLTACDQTRDGTYFVFDRRAHAVFSVAPPYDAARELVQIGAEPGRLLRPSAFALADDGSFVVADAPGNQGRIQMFLTSGASIGGFTLSTRTIPSILLDNLVLTGVGSIDYSGHSILISQPEVGALISEYSTDGRVVRTFGELRPTGHEQDRDLHLALNAGLPLINPAGGYYFVFLAGTPLFRKYDAGGKLVFERHIEGVELDDYVRNMPTAWPRRREPEIGEYPILQPAIRTAAADRAGNLWISLVTPYTYVYDPTGDKRRTLQFRGAGIISPRSFFFTYDGRVLVSPGCYAFPALASGNGAAGAKRAPTPGPAR